MAKKALLDVLEQTIGKYVLNLDAEKLNVAVWNGTIELHALQLNTVAVNQELDRQARNAPNLAIPLQVVEGQFQRLEVDVPWAQLYSKPVVFRAHGFHVVCQPYDRRAAAAAADATTTTTTSTNNNNNNSTTRNPTEQTKPQQERMQQMYEARKQSMEVSDKYRLQTQAMKKLALTEASSSSPSSDKTTSSSSSSSSFGSRLVRRIIENVQIEISDVHVQLLHGMGRAGFVLQSLSLVTTDKDGVRTFVDRTIPNPTTTTAAATTGSSLENSFLHKTLSMKGLGVYIDDDDYHGHDHDPDSLVSNYYLKRPKQVLPMISERSEQSQTSIHSSLSSSLSSSQQNHNWVLSPLSFQAQLRQADSNVCLEYAKIQLQSELSCLAITLSRSQLDVARRMTRDITGSNRTILVPLFPEYRPLQNIAPGPAAREWWRYAVRCIGRMSGRRSWMEFFLAFQKRKQYIALFHLVIGNIPPCHNSLNRNRTILFDPYQLFQFAIGKRF